MAGNLADSVSLRDDSMYRRLLENDTTLEAVVLINKKIPLLALQRLTEALTGSPIVAHVDLGGNFFKDAGAVAVAKWLATAAPALVSLGLDTNEISPAGFQAIGRALTLRSTPNLRVASFFNNVMGDAAAALGPALARLTHLYVANCGIGDKGAAAIAAALKAPHVMLLLDLSINCIGDDGAAALANALPFSETLCQLFMGHNEVGRDGLLNLSRGIGQNVSVKELTLKSNPFKTAALTTAHGAEILANLYSNSSVTKFTPGDTVPPQLAEPLVRWTGRNRQLAGAKCSLLYIITASRNFARRNGQRLWLPSELWGLICFDYLLHVGPPSPDPTQAKRGSSLVSQKRSAKR